MIDLYDKFSTFGRGIRYLEYSNGSEEEATVVAPLTASRVS